METTVCPWCQTEIVWDEEIGQEEECPHCQNELNAYRTLNIGLEDEEDEIEVQDDKSSHTSSVEQTDNSLWEPDMMSVTPAFRTIDKYEGSHDLTQYEKNTQNVLDQQAEVPECPQCHEYMLLTGQQQITGNGWKATALPITKGKVLQPPFAIDMYVCTGCFHVQTTLSEEDRLRFVEELSK
ncbi:hypothetical protein [Paenibacillus sp. CMAA1364]